MSPSSYDLEELTDACFRGELQRIEHLFKFHDDVSAFLNHRYNKALITAIYAGREAVCDLFISRGADPNRIQGSQLPLEVAARSGYPSICDLLLSAGAEVNKADAFGQRALPKAALNGNIEIVRLLCEKGADTNLSDSEGYPIHLSCSETSRASDECDHTTEILTLLVKHGADIDCCPEAGGSLLMQAATQGNLNQCVILKVLGASELFADQSGRAAIEYAIGAGHQDVIAYLAQGLLPDGFAPEQSFRASRSECLFRYRVWTSFADVSEFARRCAKNGEPVIVEVVGGGWIVPNERCQENEEGFDPLADESEWRNNRDFSEAESSAAAELERHVAVGPYMEGWLDNTQYD